jgi:thioredoxin reductase (NADPH)
MKKLKLFGKTDSPDVYPIRDFLRRSVVDFDWYELDGETKLPNKYLTQVTNNEKLPAIQFPDGKILVNPTLEEIADHLGWIVKPAHKEYDLSIYGAGPAGLSAAVYAASEGLRTILIEREAVGGQAGTSSLIENYMGFPKGISGAELAERARQQALKFGVEILLLQQGVKGTFADNRIHVDLGNGEHLVAKANICATGIEYAKLKVPGEDCFFNKGVYYGAGASEACFCSGKDVFIIGGGNSAGQAATYFAGFAKKVYMVIRKGNLSDTLSDYLVKRVTTTKNIEILFHSEVKTMEGDEMLSRICIYNSEKDTSNWYETSKLFVCIGGKPNTEWANKTAIIRDHNGYLITGSDLLSRNGFTDCWTHQRSPYHLETSVPGSFAAGDVRFNSVKRVASAVGEGAMAVTMVHKYLAETHF